MNAATGELNHLHKTYLQCVDKEITNYLAADAAARTAPATEFCTDEKKAYFAGMKRLFPHQYNNVLRVEANTY